MSQENVEVVRAFIEALNERGIQAAAAEFAAEEIEFREPPEQPGARVARGRDAAVEYFAGFDAAWDEHRSEPEEIRALDAERVLLLSVEHFRGRDGIQIDHSAGTIFTLMRGQIVLVQAFWERETALEAAGLQE